MTHDNTSIGILGGIFDPIHSGHLATAKLALDYFHLDKIYFIPAGMPPHKSNPHVAPEHRLAMLKAGISGIEKFEIWDGEIKRKGTSYTVDTLTELKKLHPCARFDFIIGSDNLSEIPLWREYKTIIKLATFCVTHRPGYSMKRPELLSSMRIKTFPGPEWKISSTLIREYLRLGFSCDYLLPSGVLEYIRQRGLYD
jgi:nicotinate-nucleotide adenylyltransferase